MDSAQSSKSEVLLDDDDFEMDELLSEFAQEEKKCIVQLDDSEDELDSLVNEFAAAGSDSTEETKPLLLSDDDEMDNLLEEFKEEECSESDLVTLKAEIKTENNLTFITNSDTKNGIFFDSSVEIVSEENNVSNSDSLDTLTSSDPLRTETIIIPSSESQISTSENNSMNNELSNTNDKVISESQLIKKNPVLAALLSDCSQKEITDQNDPVSESAIKDKNIASINSNLDHIASLKEVSSFNKNQCKITSQELSNKKTLNSLDTLLKSINIQQHCSSLGITQIKILNIASLQKTDSSIDTETPLSDEICSNELYDKGVRYSKASTVMSLSDKEEIVTHTNSNEVNSIRTHHKVLSTLPINEKSISDACSQLNCRKEESILDSDVLLDDSNVVTETEKENCPSLENNLSSGSTAHLKSDISSSNAAYNVTENLIEFKSTSSEKKESNTSTNNYIPLNGVAELKEKDLEGLSKCNGYTSFQTQPIKRKLETLDCNTDRKKRKETDFVDCKPTSNESQIKTTSKIKEIIPLNLSEKIRVHTKSLDKIALGVLENVITENYPEEISEAKTLLKNLEEKLEKQNKDLESYRSMLKGIMQSSQQAALISNSYSKKTRTVGINVRTKDYRKKQDLKKTVSSKTEKNIKSVNQFRSFKKFVPKPAAKLTETAKPFVPANIPPPNIIRQGNRLIPFLNPTKRPPLSRKAANPPVSTSAILKDSLLASSSTAPFQKKEIADKGVIKGFEIQDVSKLPENAKIILPLNQLLQMLPPESRGSVVLPVASSITTSTSSNAIKPIRYFVPPNSVNCANGVQKSDILTLNGTKSATSSLNVHSKEVRVGLRPTIRQQQPNTRPLNHPSLQQAHPTTSINDSVFSSKCTPQFHPTAPTTQLLNGAACPPIQSSSSMPSSKQTAGSTTHSSLSTKQPSHHKMKIPSVPKEVSSYSIGNPLLTKPEVKVSKKDDGQSVMVSWNLTLSEKHPKITKYEVYSCHVKNALENVPAWRKVGDIQAMRLPMACTLRQFENNNSYHFIVRAVDIHKRFGPFSEPASIYF